MSSLETQRIATCHNLQDPWIIKHLLKHKKFDINSQHTLKYNLGFFFLKIIVVFSIELIDYIILKYSDVAFFFLTFMIDPTIN